MNTKPIVISYALIGAAVLASTLYTKKLEREIIRNTKKMHEDFENLKFQVAALGK